VSAGLQIARQAGAIGAASGATFADKAVARRAAYQLATANFAGSTSFQAKVQGLGVTACGSATCGADLDAYIMKLLEGTMICGDAGGWSSYDDGRDEAFKKAIFNQALSYMTVSYANSGLTSAADWDTAYGLYGYLGHPDAGSTPYATANKRCKNYDTCDPTATGFSSGTETISDGEAKANTAIETAFVTASSANYAIIRNNILITYIQATLRYANKIDKDVTGTPASEYREHQGEGHSFGAMLISSIPGVTLSSAITTALDNTYMASPCTTGANSGATSDSTLCSGTSGRYCTLLPLLNAIVPSGTTLSGVSVTASAVAGLNAAESPKDCTSSSEPGTFPTTAYLATTNCEPVSIGSTKTASASSTSGGIMGFVVAVFAAINI